MYEKLKDNNDRPKLELVKGTRDYLPSEQLIRERIVDTLKIHFKRFGYSPIETTILEYWDIAASKYTGGAEIMKETYHMNDQGGRHLALRYELTFKLGKLIGMNRDIRMPIKRYEIGKVFRDGPVKAGRLREFTQCDIDIVGTSSLVADSEFMSIIFSVFKELNIDVYVQINNKKLLFGIFNEYNIPNEKVTDAALILDKLDKFGEETVRKELFENGISYESINNLFNLLNISMQMKTNDEKIDFFKSTLKNTLAIQGIMEIKEVFVNCGNFNVNGDLRFTPTLSRGLTYYTGTMWEVYQKNMPESKITSSLGAGGRWDNMVQKFLGCNEEYPSVGMTFGLDPIYLVLEERGLKYEYNKMCIPSVLLIPINTLSQTLKLATNLREVGISTDISIDQKVKKALELANKQKIPFVILIGNDEISNNSVKLKNMNSGSEEIILIDQVTIKLKNLLRSENI